MVGPIYKDTGNGTPVNDSEGASDKTHSVPVTPEQLAEIRACDEAVAVGTMKCNPWESVQRRIHSHQRKSGAK